MRKFHNVYSVKKWMAIKAKSDQCCWYCGCSPIQFCVDHQTARINGGNNHIDNLVLCCRSCNSRKQTKSLEEFRNYETRRVNGIPKFTNDQKRWLDSQGFAFPKLDPIKFFGECD